MEIIKHVIILWIWLCNQGLAEENCGIYVYISSTCVFRYPDKALNVCLSPVVTAVLFEVSRHHITALHSAERSPPTLPWPVGSSAGWASLPGRRQRSGGWWGSLVWSAGLLEGHSWPLGSTLSGCPLQEVCKNQITLRWSDSSEKSNKKSGIQYECQLRKALLISLQACVILS